jgi:hypothetical protein
MRPGRFSDAGFLANHERLVDVIAHDMQVVAGLSVTPEQIGDCLQSIADDAFGTERERVARLNRLVSPPGVLVRGRYRVVGTAYLGEQTCPFEDDHGKPCEDLTYACFDFALRDIETGMELSFPGLAIHLIRDHHFFEGTVPYRVDPARAVAILGLCPS